MSSRPQPTNQPTAIGASLQQAETIEDSLNEDDSNDLPSGYWRSYRFIGSLGAIVLLANGLYIGYVMPGMHREDHPLRKQSNFGISECSFGH